MTEGSAPQSDVGPVGRFRQIDALRAFAMAGVVFVHTWVNDPRLAGMRVTLFFVVSGYLMTRMLLAGRDRGGRRTIINFYIRRELRLLPALFALLAVTALFGAAGVRPSILWHIFQLTNLYFALYNTWEPYVLDHLWSLSVLEQFYLVWPLLIILLPKQVLGWTLWLLLAFGPVFRLFTGQGYAVGLGLLPFAWTDAVSAGALIAFYWRPRPERFFWLGNPLLALFALGLMLSPLAFKSYDPSVYQLQLVCGCSVLLLGALVEYRGALGHMLSSRFLSYIGKISYGVFMYHLIIWHFVVHVGIPGERGPQTFAIVLALSVGCAAISWEVMERPISELKRFFPVGEPSSGADAGKNARGPTTSRGKTK